MEDSDDHMLLNLTTNITEEGNLFGDRVKGKKSAKNKVKKVKSLTKQKLSTSKERKVIRNESKETFQVISSLFNKNPDIPVISNEILDHETHCSKKDETFSASEFKHLNLAPLMIFLLSKLVEEMKSTFGSGKICYCLMFERISNLESNLDITKMTSVQRATIPLLIDGKDMFIKSPTGTGKTLAYVIPVAQSLQATFPKIQRVHGPYCIVLVPTRELALQSLTVIQHVLKPFIWIVPGCVTGGERRKSEKARLRKGINVLVATPGRLVDHLKTTQCLQLTNIQWLVLDEADRLLDLGFEQDLSFILSAIKQQAKNKVQKVLLSATLSKDVKRLANITLDKPVTINLSEQDSIPSVSDGGKDEYKTPNELKQFCVVVPMKLRLVTLAAFLKQNYKKSCKIIVFFTTQDSVDFHHKLFSSALTTLKGKEMSFMKLHGKLTQQERTKIFLDFKKSDIGVLLSTDVAARGLDLPSVNWIVQSVSLYFTAGGPCMRDVARLSESMGNPLYNPPVSAADYVHRVGRTARIGSSGQALLFLLPTEVGFLNVLGEHSIRLLEVKMNDILDVLVPEKSKTSKVSDQVEFYEAVTSQHILFEESLNEVSNKEIKKLARTAFHSFIGAYSTFPSSVKTIFHPKNLHLGHLAKSFALRETPTELKQSAPKRSQSDGRKIKTGVKRRRIEIS